MFGTFHASQHGLGRPSVTAGSPGYHRCLICACCCGAQAKALDGVMREVNARFGKGSLMKMGSQPDKVV